MIKLVYQVFHAAKGAATDCLLGDNAEEALDLITALRMIRKLVP
jgi:hypothetical protein